MKKVDLEIKRMLSLLETQMGNVKPLLSEQLEDEEKGGQTIGATTPESILERMKETGCLANKQGATKISAIGKWKPEYIDLVNKNKQTQITAGDPYIQFMMNDSEGNPGKFFVFGKRGLGPEGTFLLLRRTQNMTKKGETGYEKPHFTEEAIKCPEFTISKSDISQDVKLTADQVQRRDDILRSGAMETGYSYTTEKPTSGVGTKYIAVDLSTGEGTDGKQYIKKTYIDSLKNVFPTPGRFYIWADLRQEERKRDLPKDVEQMLAKMGYTREQPPIGSTEEYKGTTLKELCKSSRNCSPGLQEYADSVEDGRRVWPMTAKQKADAEKEFGIKISDYKSFVATSAGGREAKSAIKDVKKSMANKDSCRAAISVLHACMKSNDDADCADYINSTYKENYKGGENAYFDTLNTLKKLVLKCDNQDVKLSGFWGGKSYDTMKDELKKSTSKFTPYSEVERRDISLEESLTRNIRNTIREHARKNMRSRRYL